MNKTLFTLIGSSVLASGLMIAVSSAPAQALTLNFGNIPTTTPSEQVGDPYVGSFKLDVTSNAPGKALFKFSNNATGQIFRILDVHFENTGNLLSNIITNVSNTGVVDFSDISPGNLPQGTNVEFNDAFAARFQGGGGDNRVNAGEVLGIQFDVSNYSALETALSNGSLLVGIHVGSLPGGASDSFVTASTGAVPEPFTILGVGTAIGFGTFFKKRLAKSKQA